MKRLRKGKTQRLHIIRRKRKNKNNRKDKDKENNKKKKTRSRRVTTERRQKGQKSQSKK